jgi:hypothetical protein
MSINVKENRRCNQEWTTKSQKHHWAKEKERKQTKQTNNRKKNQKSYI